MLANVIEKEKVHAIHGLEGAAFRAVIVGRDSLTSDLLADQLIHNLNCDAVSAHRSNLLRILETNRITLVIISADLNSVAGAGLDLANAVSSAHPDTRIIILMDEPVKDLVIRAFRSGAHGVFSQQDPMSDFIDCVEHVKKGFMWVGKEATNYCLDAFRHIPTTSARTNYDSLTLTTRELQVVQHAAMGNTNKTIARELHLSEHTVKNYLFKAFEKLGVSNRVELLLHLQAKEYEHYFSPLKCTALGKLERDFSECSVGQQPRISGQK
jgi:DNA-binding NarL/FixJ family response regulator